MSGNTFGEDMRQQLVDTLKQYETEPQHHSPLNELIMIIQKPIVEEQYRIETINRKLELDNKRLTKQIKELEKQQK